MSDLFRLTHTKVETFFRCRKQYWFRYIAKEPPSPKMQTPAGIIGTGVHRGLKALCQTGDPADAYHELEAYLRMPSHEEVGPGTEHHATAFELLDRGIAAHESIPSRERWAERDTWVPAKRRGITVSAKLDRADWLGGDDWQIIDWKTGKYDDGEKIDAQLDLYHLVLRTTLQLPHGANVRAIGWNLRTGNQRVRLLTWDDAAATMRYLYGVAKRMQAAEAEAVFPATPNPSCIFCEWRDRCPEAANIELAAEQWFEDDDGEPLADFDELGEE